MVEDPTARLETSCTRTGRPRRHLTPVRQQVGERRLRPYGSHARHRGVTLRHSTDESFEQRRQARRRRVRREGCGSRRTLFHLTRTRLRAGLRVSHGWASVRPTDMAGRYSSKIRTGCANQRPSGSVRGAASDGCPYRDLTTPESARHWADGRQTGSDCVDLRQTVNQKLSGPRFPVHAVMKS